MELEVSFDVLKQHLKDFSLYNVVNSPHLQKQVKKQRFIVPFIFVIALSLIGLLRADMTTWITIGVIVYLAWAMVYNKWYIRAVKKNIKKDVDAAVGDIDHIGHCKLILKDSEIVEESNSRVHNFKYKDIMRLVETEEYVFVYNTENSGYVIPKEKFDDKEHQKNYINMLANKTHKEVELW